jgi:uncharacterized protein
VLTLQVEAMSAAFARQNEPSMDDILASIRKIISDDIGGSGQSSDDASMPSHGASVLELLPETAISRASLDWSERSSVAASTVSTSSAPRDAHGAAEALDPRLPMAQHKAAEPSSFDVKAPHFGVKSTDEAANSEAERVVSAAFTSLRQSLEEQAAPRLDLSSATQLIVEATLRPMLKEWLDANLPALVERLVSAEIERMARRG